MKICPNCRTEYTDNALQFCLQDGTPLVDSRDFSNSNTESETIISPKRVEQIHFDPPSSFQTNQTNERGTEPYIIEREEKKSNTAMVAALSVLSTLLAVGLIGAGIWFYSKGDKKVVVVNNNSATPNRSVNANNSNNQNANANANANVNANLATPSPTPTAKPTINPEQAKTISNDVKDVVDNWKNTSENLDIAGNISNYAGTVDYYNGGKVNISKVREDREKAYSDFDSIEINIDNLRVLPDATGEKATAIFDKEWKFEGAEKRSEGRVQQQLILEKVNGKWLISSEKDVRVYYKQ